MRFEYMVFSGGGVNGLFLVGSLLFIEQLGMLPGMRGFAGTSVGALVAFFCTVGMPVQEMVGLMQEQLVHLDPLMGGLQLSAESLQRRGMVAPDILENLIQSVLRRYLHVPDITFRELRRRTGKELVVCAANLNHVRCVMFSNRTPDVSVTRALLASMSIPLLFPPVQIGDSLYVDGGVLRNFIIGEFPPAKTLGVWLRVQPKTINTHKLLTCLPSFASQLSRLLVYSQDEVLDSLLSTHSTIQIRTSRYSVPMSSSNVGVSHMLFSGFLRTFLYFRQEDQAIKLMVHLCCWRPRKRQRIV